MHNDTLDIKTIDTLRDIPGLMAVNDRAPNRRECYKVLMVTKGIGVFTLGLNTYYIAAPTILFIHPNDIISWKSLSDVAGGYYCLIKKPVLHDHPQLKATIDKYGLFSEKEKSVIRLGEADIPVLSELFVRMQEEELSGHALRDDAIQAYLQLLMVHSARVARFPEPDAVSGEFRHVHNFFQLLEAETMHINYTSPIRIKTAKEFAASLSLHPNHLNALLKKHTGQNVSTHIRNRLLEASKILLLQTRWSLQDIAYSIGFSEQPNFNLFFKKNTGVTPAEFRRRKRDVGGRR
ncbi:helix-turn-helix domain-containing protein [Chitinophaga japonensis]|uniref:AraC-like DNA-binding protein n=1 Tax=Chitinophaga japonensis TaxID=104662 RepID=A0A562T4D5_CHIJA|nr:response regulator transcription factor [Chitinophaga japonensis]TWI88233.1 AraC-like DNA-binding protein [Chitinophaga japonensis]